MSLTTSDYSNIHKRNSGAGVSDSGPFSVGEIADEQGGGQTATLTGRRFRYSRVIIIMAILGVSAVVVLVGVLTLASGQENGAGPKVTEKVSTNY